MTTVYVFGAGASYHAGYPLASSMGASLLKEMLRSPNHLHVSAAEYLSDHFGEPGDFEDWITRIESRHAEAHNDPTEEGKREYQRLGNRLAWLRTGISEWFGQIRNGSVANLYAEFANRI